jgi:phosphonate transport system substrate-binding protein
MKSWAANFTRMVCVALGLLFASALVVGCGGEAQEGAAQGDEGGEPEKIRLVISEVLDLEGLQRNFGPFKDELSEVLGAEVEFYPVPSLSAAAAALEADRADLVLAGPSEYVLLRSRADARPVVGFSRPGYRAIITAHADSGIRSLEDLKGKEILLSVPGGTTSHLAPCKMLKDAGVECGTDVKVVMLGQFTAATAAFAEGEAPALGTAASERESLLEENKDLTEEDIPVIAEGPQLPPDVFMANPNTLSEDRIEEIRSRMLENEQAIVRAMLEGGEEAEKYQGSKLVSVEDSDYDYMREAYSAIGVDEEELPDQLEQ